MRGPDDVIHPEDQAVLPQVMAASVPAWPPCLATIDKATSLVKSLAVAANEEAISIQPAFISHLDVPNAVMVPIADAGATWDLFVVWQMFPLAVNAVRY